MYEMCPQCDCTCSRGYVLFFKLLALLLRGPEQVCMAIDNRTRKLYTLGRSEISVHMCGITSNSEVY